MGTQPGFCWRHKNGCNTMLLLAVRGSPACACTIGSRKSGTAVHPASAGVGAERYERSTQRHAIHDLFNSHSKTAARAVFTEIAERCGTKAAQAVGLLEECLDEATAVLTLPWKYRRRLRSTNMVERLIEELRRRERVIRIFPNAASAERLMGALLVERHERWVTGPRYFTVESPGGISPPGAHRTIREPLSSYGSPHETAPDYKPKRLCLSHRSPPEISCSHKTDLTGPPLRSTPITGASALLREAPPQCPVSVRNRSRDHRLRHSLIPRTTGSCGPQ